MPKVPGFIPTPAPPPNLKLLAQIRQRERGKKARQSKYKIHQQNPDVWAGNPVHVRHKKSALIDKTLIAEQIDNLRHVRSISQEK